MDQYVIVETARGIEYGKVVVPMRQVVKMMLFYHLKQVVRPADERDRIQVEENSIRIEACFELANTKIIEHKLRNEAS